MAGARRSEHPAISASTVSISHVSPCACLRWVSRVLLGSGVCRCVPAVGCAGPRGLCDVEARLTWLSIMFSVHVCGPDICPTACCAWNVGHTPTCVHTGTETTLVLFGLGRDLTSSEGVAGINCLAGARWLYHPVRGKWRERKVPGACTFSGAHVVGGALLVEAINTGLGNSEGVSDEDADKGSGTPPGAVFASLC